jgi:hypothetical protein
VTGIPALTQIARAVAVHRGGQLTAGDPFGRGGRTIITWTLVPTGGWTVLTFARENEVLAPGA